MDHRLEGEGETDGFGSRLLEWELLARKQLDKMTMMGHLTIMRSNRYGLGLKTSPIDI